MPAVLKNTYAIALVLLSCISFGQNDRLKPSNSGAEPIKFSGFIGKPGGKVSGVMKSAIPLDVVKKECAFFSGDSLNGFDFDLTSIQLEKDGYRLYMEFQVMMHRAQNSFVKEKYKLDDLPHFSKLPAPYNPPVPLASSCANLDFEDGNFTNWLAASGYNTNSNGNLTLAGTAFYDVNKDIYDCADLNLITAAYGNDPLGFPGLDPAGGAYSVRLGGFNINTSHGYGFGCGPLKWWNLSYSNGELLEQNFVVTAANSLLDFDYAVVLNDGGHPNGQQPYFHVYVKDAGTGVVLSSCTQYYVQAAAGAPPAGFSNSGFVNTNDNSVLYSKNWTSNSINLTPYIGTTVNIEFVAAGCTAGAHMAWAYVDVTCGPADIIASNIAPCPSQTVTLTAPSISGGSYAWYGSGVTGLTTQTVGVTTSGTYTVVVTPSQGVSCAYTLTKNLTFNTSPTLAISSVSNPTLCSNNSSLITPSGASTYTLLNSGATGTSFNVSPTSTTTYSIIGTSAAGCQSANTAVTTITVETTPTVGISGVSSPVICSNNSSLITPSGASTYTLLNSGATGTSFNVSPTSTTTYSIIGSSASGCTSTNTITTTITVNTSPTVAISSVSNPIICSGNSSLITPSGASTYTLLNSGATGTSFNVSPTGTTTYSIIGISASSCPSTNTITTTITVNTSPTVAISSVSNPSICSGNSSLITLSGASSYTLLNSGATGSSFNVSPTSTTTYSIIGESTSNCPSTNTITTTIIVNAIPSSATSVTNSVTCLTSTVNLNSTNIAGASYTWTSPSGASILSPGANANNTIGDGAGTYTLNIISSAGCSYSTTALVSTDVTPPTGVSAGPSQTLVCGAANVTLSGTANPSNSTINWLGGVCGSATSLTTTACAPNTYTLVVLHPVSGCSVSSVMTVSSSTDVPQATTNAITNSITCSNTVVAIGVTSPDPVNYSWTGPGISGASNTAATSATLAGTYTVVVTNSLTSCTTTLNATVQSDAAPVTATVSAPGSITCTNTLVTLNSGPVGASYSYTWSGSGINTSLNNQSVNVIQGGNFVVAITNTINGCQGSYTVSVPTLTTPPSVTVAPSSYTTSCAIPTVQLVASSTSSDLTYSWTANGGTLDFTNVSNPIATGGGTYDVLITNTISGCQSMATATVVPDAGVPVISLSANSLTITCTNTTVTSAITSTNTTLSYTWSPNPVSGGANPVFNAQGIYNSTITATNGCSTYTTINVDVNNSVPTVTLSPTSNEDKLTCTKLMVILNPSLPSGSNLTYTWSPSAGISTPINQANATFTATGIYTLAITNTLTGCKSSSTNSANTFTVNADTIRPTASINITSTNTIIGCGAGNSSVTFSSTTTSSNTPIITWLPNNVSTATLTVTTADIYTLVVVDAINGCSVTTQYTVGGSTTPPQGVNAGTLASIACGSSTTTLNGVTSSPNVSYLWAGPSAVSIISGSNSANPIVNEVGTYTLTVTDTLTGCQSTANVNVTQANVTAIFTANPTSGIAPLTVSFTDASIGATSYSWNFGDSNSSFLQNPNNTYSSGTYTAILTASSGPCTSTASIVIVVEDGLMLEIPNVFTPNNDGSNDVFIIKSSGIKEISLQIFNRWGQRLYEFTGPKASWDGITAQGGKAPEGTYFFFVKASGFDDKTIEKNGTVNLFR